MSSRVPLIALLFLVGVWLLLNGTVSLGQIVLGTLLSIMFLLAVSSLHPFGARVKRLHLAIPLALVVLLDILRSNLAVGRIALGLVPRQALTSGFLDIPLDLRDPHGLAVLAVIVTATPGTAWAGVSLDGKTLQLHVLDLHNEAEWIATIKHRYEQPLMRIFE